MDSLQLPVDADGYITIFDGKTFNGWRGYGKDRVPSKWTIEDGCIKFNGSGSGEAQNGDGGDLIFAHKFKNIIRKSKFPQNPKRSVRFSGKRTKRSVQKRKARNTQKAETKVL